MSAIDFHTHAFPDEIASRAMAKLQAAGGVPAYGDGTLGDLLRSMDQADIDISVVCPIATKPGQAEGILKWCRKIHGDRIEPFPSVHPDDPDAARWVARFAEEGFAGIKLHPQYQAFAADEPRMDPIYAAAAEQGLVITSHCGLDLAYPDDNDHASPVRFAKVIERFPSLPLVCTHMGGWRAWNLVDLHLVGRPVWLETSFSLEELGPQRAMDMIRRHGPDRVLFGTDWPWKPQDKELALASALALDPKEKNYLLWGNAAKLLGY